MYLIILYLDPGTGSLILQIILGGLLAGLLFFKNIWFRLTSFFKSKKK